MKILPSLLLLVPSLALADAMPKPPAAPIHEVRDTYFGTVVVDPYRWLENEHAPEVESWVRAQDKFTRAALSLIPGREALQTRIAALSGSDVSVSSVQRARKRWFYLKREPSWQNSRLVVREGERERVLFDPEAAAKSGEPHRAVDYYLPSRSGDFVIVGASPGGSEDSSLSVLDVKSGRVVDGPIDRAEFAQPSWLDDKTFAYARRQIMKPGMAPTERYYKRRAYLHRVGTPAESDVALAGLDVPGSPPLGLFDSPAVWFVPDVPYAFLRVQHGAKPEATFYLAPLAKAPSTMPSWRKLCDDSDDVEQVVAHGDALFLHSHKDADRYRVLQTSLAHPDVAHAAVVRGPERAVVSDLFAAGDGLYIVELDGGVDRLWRVPFTGGAAREVTLPFAAALGGLGGEVDRPGVSFSLTGWTHAPAWYAFAGDTVELAPFSPLSRVDMSAFTADEVMAKGADGTQIPLSILHKKGLALDGNNPTLLDGYGAYGYAYRPRFQPGLVAWLERGGVFAVAHVRGGGEFGEAWHKAGYKTTKQHTIDDFIACAEFLVAKKWTKPARLSGSGTSAGGITIAGAVTQRPDLFGAALIRVGDSDILRTEFATDGQGNAEEYGTVKIKEQFEAMRRVSGYQRVKDGVKYPAVLLTGGFNDARVALYQSSKMAARLQAATASGKPILLRVDFDSGHGSGATKAQRDAQSADELAFLLWQLGASDFQPLP